MAYRPLPKDSLANKAFALELQKFVASTLEASSSKDEFKRDETPEESLARLRSTPFSLGLLSPLPADEIMLPKYLVGNGRKLMKKNCLGVETLISKDSLANKAFALELQKFVASTTDAASSKDEFKRDETPEESLARLRSTPFSLGLLSPLPADEIMLPKYLVGNGRKLMKKNCLGVETREEFLARIRSTPFSNDLCCDPPVDEILLPKNLVGNGRQLEKKKKKNCLGVGISNVKKKNKVARSIKCKKQRAIKV